VGCGQGLGMHTSTNRNIILEYQQECRLGQRCRECHNFCETLPTGWKRQF